MNIRIGLRLCAVAAGAVIAFVLAACTAEPQPAAPASRPAPAVDTFSQYRQAFLDRQLPLDDTQAERDKFHQGVTMYCPQGIQGMEAIKTIASTAAGRSADEQTQANLKAATAAGALWEYGCGKGHDDGLYTPQPAQTPTSPAPTKAAATTKANPNHCGDKAWWSSQGGDPSEYVKACGVWPSWVDRGDTPCLPNEKHCPVATTTKKAAPYAGPTSGAWSPQYGYYEGRTDGPKNSQGQPCMQGRDNNDPNC